MVAPVTDLGTSTVHWSLSNEFFGTYKTMSITRRRVRQKRPYTLVLPYTYYGRSIVQSSWTNPPAPIPIDSSDALPITVNWTSVENLSYERLRGKIYDTVQAGAAFAEYKQSVGLIANTATTLATAARYVKSGNLTGALTALRYQGRIPAKYREFTARGVSSSFGSNWLALHFGWEPLVKDIYNSCKILNDPVKSYSLQKGSAKDKLNTFQFITPADSAYHGLWSVVGDYAVTQRARVRFEKPGTAFTLHQFGLDNPLSVAWEVVPFSFVVDWFVNVGDFLGSLTDFAGMTLESVSRSRYLNCNYGYTRFTHSGVPPPYRFTSVNVKHVYTERFTSLSGLTLEVKKLKPPSAIRALTAISLLVQGLK